MTLAICNFDWIYFLYFFYTYTLPTILFTMYDKREHVLYIFDNLLLYSIKILYFMTSIIILDFFYLNSAIFGVVKISMLCYWCSFILYCNLPLFCNYKRTCLSNRTTVCSPTLLFVKYVCSCLATYINYKTTNCFYLFWYVLHVYVVIFSDIYGLLIEWI